jgi:hypothetical protein
LTQTTIRPSVPADAPAIVALFAAAGLKPNVEPEALHWKYWQERGDRADPRSYVATRGAQILAHAAVVPGSCAAASRRVTVLHLIDWAAQPNAAGIGVSLMKHVGRLADSLLAVGGSEHTRRILPHIGFRSCGTAEGYARVLHPLHSLSAFDAADWKFPARFARRSLWRLFSPIVAPAGWSIRRVAADEVMALAAVLPHATGELCVFERSEGLFRYMLHCPIVPMELYTLRKQDEVQGYFLLAFAPGQARIVDCWVATDEPAAWQALMQYAALQAWRRRDAAELVAWSSDDIMTGALVAGGFRRRNQQPIFLRSAAEEEIIPGRLRVQMLENDAGYFHRGFAELWA